VLTGLILTGGASTRMGSPKALLSDPEGRPFILRIIDVFAAAARDRLDQIVIVAGVHHDEIVTVLDASDPALPVRLVRNPDPARGQLSSIWSGLDAMSASTDGVLMTLVDVPMVAPATVRAVIDAWSRTRSPVVRPICDGRRGHPVIFDHAVVGELRAAPLDQGARVVVRAHWNDSVDVPVEDRGCLIDIDTPDDYERLL
jgi:CTP:molybdopterin cytidylyltransferase MocA